MLFPSQLSHALKIYDNYAPKHKIKIYGIQIYNKYLSTYNDTIERQRDTTRRIHQERNILQEEENIRQQLAIIQQRRVQIRQALALNSPRTPSQNQEEIQNNRLQLANNTHVRNREI